MMNPPLWVKFCCYGLFLFKIERTAAVMEIDEHLGKRTSHPVPTWTENPRIYSQRGSVKSHRYYNCNSFSRGNIVHMESFSNLSYVNIGLTGAIGQFLIARRRTLNHLPFKFLFVQVVAVPDLFLTAVKLSHDKTGAQYLHAARDDSNNLFRFGARQCLLEPLLSELPTLTASSLFPQRPVQNHSPGQHGGPAHPGAHGAVRVWEVSLQRPLLQDAQQVAVHVHERLHGYADAGGPKIIWKQKVLLNPLHNTVVVIVFLCVFP